mmetsp:Transcript_722/g.1262  ORF Transcript_722/g.1262 Transcript_722/m.1262 type:complete len:1268 (-) Transcript_722:93-3896(-)
MGRAMISAAVTLLFCLLPLTNAGGGGGSVTSDLGPAMPGDAKYWVLLENLLFSEGELRPKFDPKGTDFTLVIKNQAVREITATLEVQIDKYNLAYKPKLEIDAKEIKYSPLNPINVKIPINETIDAEDKVVTFTVSDPQGGTGGLFPQAPKNHKYNIHIEQPPEYDKVMIAKEVVVKTVDDITIPPVKDDGNISGTYEYVIPEEQFAATVQATCGPFASRMLINSMPAQPGEILQVEMDAPTVTTLLQCAYSNKRWSDDEVSRTYQIHFVRSGVAKVLPKMRMMPQSGYCELEDGESKKDARYICSSASSAGVMVADYDTGSENVFLDNLDSGTSLNILRGLPTKVDVGTSPKVNFKLRVVAGKAIQEVPLTLYHGQHCSEFMCPYGWVPRAKMDEGEDAILHTCKTNECTLANDGERCCREAGEPCTMWQEKWQCKSGSKFFSKGFCLGKPCVAEDWQYCCLDEEKAGRWGPAKGSKELERWEKAFKNAVDQEKKYSAKVSQVFTLKHIKMSGFDNSEEAKLAIESAIAKLIGCTADMVSVQMTGTKPITVAATVTAEDGIAKSKTYFNDLKHLESSQVEAELIASLTALGMDENELVVDEMKKAKLSVPDKPKLSTVIYLQAPPKMKVEAPDEKGSQSAKVESTLLAGLEDQLGLDVEEKMDLALSPSAKIPPDMDAGMTAVKVDLHMDLDPGDVGGLDIANAKLAIIDTQELNDFLFAELTKKGMSKSDAKLVKVVLIEGVKMKKGHAAAGFSVKHSAEYILSVWLKEQRTTTMPPVVQMIEFETNGGKCIHAGSRHQLGAPVNLRHCDSTSQKQQWTFTVPRGQIRNTFGICLAADLAGPPGSPNWQMDTSANILESWIFQRGAGGVNMWMCNDHWQQQWEYVEATGIIKLSLSNTPGVCLQVANPEDDDAYLQTAICDHNKFSQQFWFDKAPLEDFLPFASVPAEDLPHFIKPFYEGVVATKQRSGEYTFQIAPFAKKRAAFYLTQGCSPVPTKSCGTQLPDIPGDYIGQPLMKMDENVDNVPWHIAMNGAASSTNPPSATCFYDPSCSGKGNKSGCKAGGKPTCRYCGFGNFSDCPITYECGDGHLHDGGWKKDKEEWCCKHFSIGCAPPHDCLKDITTWKTSWSKPKQSWCCQYQHVGCPYDCKTDFSVWDPTVWDQDHAFWCSIFGEGTTEKTQQQAAPSKFERLIMKKNEEEGPKIETADEDTKAIIHPALAFVVTAGTCSLLLAGVLKVRRASSAPREAAERSLVMESQAFIEESSP